MGRWPRQVQAMALAVMFLLLLMPIANAQSGPTSVGEERLSMVSLSANQHEVLTLQVAANSTTLLSWNCLSCQVVVETSSPEATTSAHGSTMRSVAAFTLQRCLAQWNRAWGSTAMVCTRTTSSPNRTRANHVQVCEKHARTEARFLPSRISEQ